MDTGKYDVSKIIEDIVKYNYEKGYMQAKNEMDVILEKTFRSGYNKGYDDAMKLRCKNGQEKED